MRSLALALAFALAAVPALAQQRWRTYFNGRFGTTAQVPADWRPGREPENGDGLVFTSPDGEASITVFGGLHVLGSVKEHMDMIAAGNAGETVTYVRRDRRAVVVSGTRGQRIFYQRSILACRDTIWHTVAIEYPAARKSAFDALVARAAGSLRQGRSWQVKGCG
jgi:serine/threonine-protein kinase